MSPAALAPTLALGNTQLAGWDPQLLRAVELALATHVGPLARMLVQRAVNVGEFLDSSTMLEMATIGGARALKLDGQYHDEVLMALSLAPPGQPG